MKKITLVLCACAMAFAGLLVSCSNGSGTEEIIFRGSESNDYAYEVSGTKVVTTAYGNTATTVTTTTVTTSFDGTGTLSWETNDDATNDFQNYSLAVNTNKANKKTEKNYSGDVGKNTPAEKDEFEDYIDVNYQGYYQQNGDPIINKIYIGFRSLGDKYFAGVGDTKSTVSLTEEQEKALGKDAGTSTISVTGDIAESDTLTIVYTTIDVSNDDAETKAVDNQTTVYTLKLTKVGSAE